MAGLIFAEIGVPVMTWVVEIIIICVICIEFGQVGGLILINIVHLKKSFGKYNKIKISFYFFGGK